MTKEQLLKAIKGHRLYKLYHSPTKEISREDLQGTVNPHGEATERLFDLKRRLKDAVKRQTDFPPNLVRDNDELQQLIQTALVTLYAAGDGRIDNADFRRVFDPLAGMVEGMLAAMSCDDPNAAAELRRMTIECKHKAFMQQLRKLTEAGEPDAAALGKALSSMLTHVWIRAEKSGRVNEGLVKKLTGLVASLEDVAHAPAVLAEVRSWGLFEADVMNPIVTAQTLSPNSDKGLSGLPSKDDGACVSPKGYPAGDKRWDGKKAADVRKGTPELFGLTAAPVGGEQTDDAEEKEIEPNKLPDDAKPSKIDGQALAPDIKKNPATKESVELQISEETPVKVKYVVLLGGRQIGEATLNRRSRSCRIKGTISDRAFEATSPAHARQVVRQLLATA